MLSEQKKGSNIVSMSINEASCLVWSSLRNMLELYDKQLISLVEWWIWLDVGLFIVKIYIIFTYHATKGAR